ncbi:hypothetical protein NCS57_00492600 [Fusarium keratoplasticum]|uniref:Uncharacterized protein n=1 Tax=Fusarium keratoplasticum TaxID=1328300 RepID=A0ACC0R6T9_9HYPO|nr:hypothetical protein NCS57_00492600 [Fusarium keratoplasticum]KAI8675899.1 hypothetical protein NCS57_00492600 [Fusarium keratoplasticum]
MASTIPTSCPRAPPTLLSMPLEIRLHIFHFCIPQNLCFHCSYDIHEQNRPKGWSRPEWEDSSEASGAQSDPREVEEDTNEPYYEPCGLDDYCRKSRRHRPQGLTSSPSALPGLLLVCRQITNEVKPLLYGGNTFTFNHENDAEYGLSANFSSETKTLMRKMILLLRPGGDDRGWNPSVWEGILGNILILGVIIQKPKADIDGEYLLDEWISWLTATLQQLGPALPKTTKIVVDTNEDDSMVQIVNKEIPGRCVFQRLRVGDGIFRRGEFAAGTGLLDESDYDYDEGPTSCRDIIGDCDYDLYYSD